MNRRYFLGLALSAAAIPAWAKRKHPRILSFHNIRTGERVRVPYRIGDYYQRDVLQKLNYFMRE